VVAAGFVGFEITWRADVYADAPQESSGAKFGIQGINFRARKPGSEDELTAEMERTACAIGG
jgi:hypothetical protein